MPGTPNNTVLVEVVVESVSGALAAVAGGADRIELCSSLAQGGLTPSAGLCEAVCEAVDVPVFAMVRPRAGDFLYGQEELRVMALDVAALTEAGASGIVVGALTSDGHIDRDVLASFMRFAGGRPVTCHRAFDLCRDPDAAIDALCDLGIARVLTSGQAGSAYAGRLGIRSAVERAAGRLTVMAGAGVRMENVASLVEASGVREVHLSATEWRPSAMAFRREGVAMGAPAGDEYSIRGTSAALVAGVVAALA